ncbi:MAG: tetratricopeptide repeat protein [Acidobacteria bacterium]|nr:tetratricopeptide repeat protein [Acidobacteriota bacterium]
MRRARELAPLSLRTNGALGWVLFVSRQYDQAIEQSRRTLEIDPNYHGAHWVLGQAYEQKGKHDEAIAELRQAVVVGNNPGYKAHLAHAYAVAGRKGEARKLLAELGAGPEPLYVPPTHLAEVYVGLGDKEEAFARLEQAYQVRDSQLTLIRTLPQFDPLRSDPRFQDLLRRMNFPE